MGVEFGQMLRSERLRRGLTQSQLGEGAYEPSYISMLETGRLEPTAETIQDLSGRLASAPGAMPWWSHPRMPSEARYVFASLCAQAAYDVREYARASSHAEVAAELALEAENAQAWWTMTFMQADCLMREGRLTRSLRIAKRLLEDPVVAENTELAARTHELYAEVCHRHGQIDAAVEHARQAAELAEGLPARSPVRIASLCELIAALTDSGLLEAAWDCCGRLEGMVAKAPLDPTMVCHAEWVIGNVAFIRSDDAEGVRHHDRTAQFLMTLKDIELWARFNRSSAAARLEGGNLGPDTLAAIDRAELALVIVGGSDAEQLETALVRARWFYLTGQLQEAAHLLQGITRERHLLGPHVAAEACLLYGECLLDLGRGEEALGTFEEAHEQFAYAGVHRKAELASERLAAVRELLASAGTPAGQGAEEMEARPRATA